MLLPCLCPLLVSLFSRKTLVFEHPVRVHFVVIMTESVALAEGVCAYEFTDRCFCCESSSDLFLFECPIPTSGYKTRYLVCQDCSIDHKCRFCGRQSDHTNFGDYITDSESELESFEVTHGVASHAVLREFDFPQHLIVYDSNTALHLAAHHDEMWFPYYHNNAGYSMQRLPQSSSLSDQLAFQLQHFFEHFLQNVPDQRHGRDSRVLKIYQVVPDALPITSQPYLSGLFDIVLQHAEDLALEERIDKNIPSRGSEVVQKILVLSQMHEKTQLIRQLLRSASRLIYHDSGCFVVSQIIQEALTSTPGSDSVVEAAHDFMLKAHAGTIHRDYENNLVKSMLHLHSNHSFKMWIILLISSPLLTETPVLDAILHVVKTHTLDLVMDCQGVRSVNVLLSHFLKNKQDKVKPIVKTLVEDEVRLDGLIRHEFANHTIQVLIDDKPEDICRVVWKNFPEYALHQYANYAVQKCIASPACGNWLLRFAETFIEHREIIEGNWNSSVAISRSLGNALKKQGERQMARKLEYCCSETQNQRQLQKWPFNAHAGWNTSQWIGQNAWHSHWAASQW